MYEINGAFTSENICLAEYTYEIEAIQKRYSHLEGIPLPSIDRAAPVILISSDYANLIVPTLPVQFGPKGAPVAVCTRLGWTLQGPAGTIRDLITEQNVC